VVKVVGLERGGRGRLGFADASWDAALDAPAAGADASAAGAIPPQPDSAPTSMTATSNRDSSLDFFIAYLQILYL
jgi:hypothetical protein